MRAAAEEEEEVVVSRSLQRERTRDNARQRERKRAHERERDGKRRIFKILMGEGKQKGKRKRVCVRARGHGGAWLSRALRGQGRQHSRDCAAELARNKRLHRRVVGELGVCAGVDLPCAALHRGEPPRKTNARPRARLALLRLPHDPNPAEAHGGKGGDSLPSSCSAETLHELTHFTRQTDRGELRRRGVLKLYALKSAGLADDPRPPLVLTWRKQGNRGERGPQERALARIWPFKDRICYIYYLALPSITRDTRREGEKLNFA